MNLSAEILEQAIRKVISENSDITLIQFRDEYIEAIEFTHSESYLRSVKQSFSQLLSYCDNVSLLKLDTKYLENFIIATFRRSKYAAGLYYRTLKAAFTKAEDWNYIPKNPFTKIKLPKFQKEKPVYVTLNELNKILEKLEPESLRDVYLFDFYTGLRLSELINLKWSCVNLNEGLIKIGDPKFQTKSKEVRTVPLCLAAKEILLNRFPKIIKQKDGFVFVKNNSFPFTADYISKTFKKAVKLTEGINDKIHFHSLRHSFASNLVNQGAPLYNISKLMGHSSIAVTEVYSHLDIDSLKQTINKFNLERKVI